MVYTVVSPSVDVIVGFLCEVRGPDQMQLVGEGSSLDGIADDGWNWIVPDCFKRLNIHDSRDPDSLTLNYTT